MSTSTSFDVLPTEIASYVCALLKQPEVSHLSLVNKSFYRLVRPVLYRHPVINTYASLILFSRTISRATYMGKVDRKWSDKESLDQTRTLKLTLDPTKYNAEPLPAVMISRTIQAIVRRCPSLAISLYFEHCQCRLSPVSVLGTETFPGVTTLVIYVGKHDPEDVHSSNKEMEDCKPSAAFWRPFVDGTTFPDCSNLEIRHFWATNPPSKASLDLQKQYPRYDFYAGSYGIPAPPARLGTRMAGFNRLRQRMIDPPYVEHIGSTDGLKRFKSIILECPPEINSLLLMQLLGNPNAVASNLTSLELRFCNLAYETYSKLLYHAPPNVKRLVLLSCDDQDVDYHGPSSEDVPHLCPLIRVFSKNLIHLEFGATNVCRELFFDETERQSLRHDGVDTGLGNTGGAIDKDSGRLDGHAIREAIQACRKQKRMKYRSDRINDAVTVKRVKLNPESSSSSLFGGNPSTSNTDRAEAKVQREVEVLLDEEEERRSRMIEGAKTPWFRRIISYHGLCNASDTWAEMQIAAEMEEKGIEWVLANKELQQASQHSKDKASIDIDLELALREKYIYDHEGLTSPTATCDDSSMGVEGREV